MTLWTFSYDVTANQSTRPLCDRLVKETVLPYSFASFSGRRLKHIFFLMELLYIACKLNDINMLYNIQNYAYIILKLRHTAIAVFLKACNGNYHCGPSVWMYVGPADVYMQRKWICIIFTLIFCIHPAWNSMLIVGKIRNLWLDNISKPLN